MLTACRYGDMMDGISSISIDVDLMYEVCRCGHDVRHVCLDVCHLCLVCVMYVWMVRRC